MANVNQIYLMVNDVASEMYGEQAITVKNTSTLVSLGDTVLSSDKDKEKFYNALVDRIGRTVIAVREYTPKDRSVKRDEMDWGLIYQKISFKKHEAVDNPSWEASTQANPFDIEVSTEAVQKLFSKIGTFNYEDSIPDYQLFTAFQNASAMGAFISGIYTNIENAMKVAEEGLANLAVDTYMAGALIKGKSTQKRNLLAEYNTANGTELTVTQALKNADFLKFASREINIVVQNMKVMSTLYNAENIPRFTPNDKLVVEILGQFASATASYLESDTYHNELVKLPRYEEVPYWQGTGTSFAFDDVSKIDITNSELAVPEQNPTGTISQTGIIAFVHDYDAVASIIYKRRSHAYYNYRAERVNYTVKADKGYAVDLSENGVVFYMA